MKELKYLNKYFIKYKYRLAFGVIITFIANVFKILVPNQVKKAGNLIEDYIQSGKNDLDLLSSDITYYLLIIIGTALLAGFFIFLMRQSLIVMSRIIEYDLKNEVFVKYQKLSTNFYKKNRIGDLMSRISEDVSKVRMSFGPALMYSINTGALFICLVPYMFYVAPKLALYTLLPLPILSISIYLLSKAIHTRSTIVQQYLSKLTIFSQETFSGISVIKAYGIEQQTQERFNNLSEESKEVNLNLVKVQAWFFPFMILLIGASNLMVIYVGGQEYIKGAIKIGTLVQFLMYVNMLTWPVATVGWVTSIIQQAEASQKRINEFLKETDIIQNTNDESKEITGDITFQNVSFTYEDTNIKALKNVSFNIKQGSSFAIIGKTGSGKSTILNLLCRLYDVNQGEVMVNGENLNTLNLEDLRKSFGVVPQDPFLFSDTIKNNILFGKAEATDEEVYEAAKLAVIHENISGFKEGYNTILGERGITLSGGQKQRTSIARAIIKKPNFFLFDDCLSAVDTETEERILKNLKQISQGKTSIIVSHRISSVKHSDYIIVLDEGEIIQQGIHEQLINQEGYYKDLYLKQLSEKEIS
ncbi:MAG: ABC transporter ATP-binding protein [Flavobacteriaceae bacterium]|nr:ABC transporter ATP-binding protein [Flavobacteriaceae bacterium]